tara:strand:+ start:1052 stop:1243 length:192 start_codon:yes stop_codon:yes gene_type:complete
MSIYSEIEAKRNQEINERNLLSMLIEEQGNSHERQKQLMRYRGRIEAYNNALVIVSKIGEVIR